MSVVIEGEVFPHVKRAAVVGAERSGLPVTCVEPRIRRAIKAGRPLLWAELLAPRKVNNKRKIELDGVEYPSLAEMYADVASRSGIAETTIKARLRVARKRGEEVTYELLTRPVADSRDALRDAVKRRLPKTDCRDEIAQAIANTEARRREIAMREAVGL